MRYRVENLRKGQRRVAPAFVLKKIICFVVVACVFVGLFGMLDTMRVKAQDDCWSWSGGSNVSSLGKTGKNIVMLYHTWSGYDYDYRYDEYWDYREGTFDMYSNCFMTIPRFLENSTQWYPSGLAESNTWFDNDSYNNFTRVSYSDENRDHLVTRQNAIYTTLKTFTAPYSGYFNIDCVAPKGQGGRIGCWMHSGGVGGYGSAFNGDIWLNEGETLIFLMGPAMGEAVQVGDAYEGDDEANCSGLSGASIFIYKYVNSDNLVGAYNEVMTKRGLSRTYDSSRDILVYFQYEGWQAHIEMPNASLVAIVGGGGGYNAHCEPEGTDFEFNGSGSGYWYNESVWRNAQALKGAKPRDASGTVYVGPTTEDLAYGWQDKVMSDISDGFRQTFKGLYKNADGSYSEIGGSVYEETGNGSNQSKVTITSVGNYIHYNANTPAGLMGGGSMNATRVSMGVDAVLAENVFTAGGMKFAGWGTSPSGSVVYTDKQNIGKISSDITVYAMWKPNDYTIKYIANPPAGRVASGSMVDAVIESGNGYTLDKNAYAVEGYTFKGWSTTANGLVEYSDCDSVGAREDDLVLYAVWAGNKYGVNVYNNLPESYSGSIINIK